jgi:hypothetical protein
MPLPAVFWSYVKNLTLSTCVRGNAQQRLYTTRIITMYVNHKKEVNTVMYVPFLKVWVKYNNNKNTKKCNMKIPLHYVIYKQCTAIMYKVYLKMRYA